MFRWPDPHEPQPWLRQLLVFRLEKHSYASLVHEIVTVIAGIANGEVKADRDPPSDACHLQPLIRCGGFEHGQARLAGFP